MAEAKIISEDNLRTIALRIKELFFAPVKSNKISLFLCGGDITRPNTMRAKLAHELQDAEFEVIFPEDIFEELLFNSHSNDLLSLENILAESVDVIVIIPESAGSFTELGAFVNNNILREKVICVVGPEYKKQKSFIAQGPIKLMKGAEIKRVFYADASSINQRELSTIKTSIRKVSATSLKKNETIGLLELESFLLPVIYLLEPVPLDILINSFVFANNQQDNAKTATVTALSMLVKKKLVELSSLGYKLTKLGITTFWERQERNQLGKKKTTIALDEMRLEIYNLIYRNKKLKV